MIKSTVRYHLTPVILATIKSLPITNSEEGVEKRKPSYTVGGNVSWYSTMENSMEVPQKGKNRVTI